MTTNKTDPIVASASSPETFDVPMLLEGLGQDVLLNVFSFLAEAPLEKMPVTRETKCALTKILPELSKHCKELSEENCIWKPAIIRQLRREPGLWKEGLLNLMRRKKWNSDDLQQGESKTRFLERVHTTLDCPSYKNLYRQVVTEHVRFTGPVFYMQGHVLLGDSYRVHMFERRYRLMMAEVMEGYPQEAKRGGPIIPSANRPPPLFIHANHREGSHCTDDNTPACLVQVLHCNIWDRDGTVDVLLRPIAYVWLEKVWVRPDSRNLNFAQCLRMGAQATKDLKKQVNQEALSTVMNWVGDYYVEDDDWDDVDDPDETSVDEDDDSDDEAVFFDDDSESSEDDIY